MKPGGGSRMPMRTLGVAEDLLRLGHYGPPRYPNLHPSVPPAFKLYGRGDAEACLEAARSVLDFARSLLRR